MSRRRRDIDFAVALLWGVSCGIVGTLGLLHAIGMLP